MVNQNTGQNEVIFDPATGCTDEIYAEMGSCMLVASGAQCKTECGFGAVSLASTREAQEPVSVTPLRQIDEPFTNFIRPLI